MIKVSHINKAFKTSLSEKIKALDDVSLSFPDRGLIFIVGKSGSGKSTFLSCLGGIEHPDSGEILFNGKNIVSLDGHSLDRYRQNSIGFCFQKYNIIGDLSVEDNIRLSGETKEKNSQCVKDALALVDLSGFEKRKASELSGGQQQRVAIGRSIYKHPAVILADEPTGALDSETGKQVLETFKKASLSCLVIVVTHDLSDAEKYGDRIIRLSDGKVVSDSLISQPLQNVSKENPLELRAPFSIKAKLCFNSLKKMPIRLCATVLLLGCAFAALGPVLGTLMRDDDEMLADSIVSARTQYLSINKERKTITGTYTPRKMFPSDVSSLSEEFGGPFLSVYNGVDSTTGYNGINFASYDIVTPDSTSFAHYLQGSSAGVAPISNKILDEMGMSLSYGTLPTSDDECLIPLCQYEQFAKYGFQHQDVVLPAKEIQTPSAFLGFSPSLYVNFGSSGATMRIVGFVDTKLDYNDYPNTISSDTQKGNAALTELSDEFAYGPNRLVFVAPSMIANNFPSNQAINIGNSEELQFNSGSYQQSFASIYQADSSNSISLAGINDGNSIYLPLGSFGKALGTYSLPLAAEEEVDYSPCKSYFTPFSSLKTSSALQDPEVFFAAPTSDNFSVLSLTACGSYVKTNGLPSEGKELTDLINFAQNDYDQALVQGTVSKAIDFSSRSSATDDILKSFYTLYLASNYNETIGETGGFLKNSFGSRSGYQITFDFSQKLFSKISLSKTINVSLGAKSVTKGEYSLSGILGGLYFEAFDVFRAEIGLSTDLFNTMKTSLGDCGPIAFSFMKCPSDKNLIKRVISEGESSLNSDRYLLHNRCMAAYQYIGYSLGSTLLTFLLVISTVLVVFSNVLLITIISSATKARSKETTIMRCLGVSKTSVFMQYLAEVSIIGVFSFVLAVVLNLILVPALNGYAASISGLSLAFFGISFGSVMLLLLLILLGCFVSSFFPAFVSSTKSLSRRLNDD